MKTFLETFKHKSPNGKNEYGYFDAGCYSDITNQIGESVLEVSDNDYLGDTRILYERGDEFGYLQFGWGSCSGCDALEGCNSPKDWEDLANRLESETQWKPKAEMLQFFKTHDWKGDYSWHDDEQKKFVVGAIAYMEKALGQL